MVHSRERSLLSPYSGYSMATEAPGAAAPLELGNTASHKFKLRCSVPECPQNLEFPSESALRSVPSSPTTSLTPALTNPRKHEAKHSKTFICQVANCKHTLFGDKGGLDRHNREVHGSAGSQTYCCPVTTCKRHVRGFPRKYNLFEHQKRCHPSQSPNSTSPPTSGPQGPAAYRTKVQQEVGHENRSFAEMTTASGDGRLKEKLENLYKMRAENEGNIEALERALKFLGGDSP